MTQQTQNFAELCKGNNLATVERAVKAVKKSIVEELMSEYRLTSQAELVEHLALGF